MLTKINLNEKAIAYRRRLRMHILKDIITSPHNFTLHSHTFQKVIVVNKLLIKYLRRVRST